MTTTDWRELCAELADHLHDYASGNLYHDSDALVARARAALAQPKHEVVGPTDGELDSLEHRHWEETGVEEWGRREAIFNHRTFARAVLARYGHQPAPPAEGEVGELVDRLRRASDGASAMGWEQDSWVIARAADLLEQRHPTPVPVANPTDEQLLATVDAVSVTLPPLPMDHTDAHSRINYDVAWRVAMARAVLARWGGQAAP